MSRLEIKYVWEIPVRVTHWVTMLSIVTLSITGFLIGNPKTLASETSQFVMGWIRFIHFSTAYVFAIGLTIRIYCAFVGNRYCSWRTFFPWATAEGRERMIGTLFYYSLIKKKLPHVVGHNPVAAIAYSGVMILYIVMIVTGFSLYAEHSPGSALYRIFGWLPGMLPNQYLRLIHHSSMWLIIGFAINHIYSCWLMDIKERGGIISSMFSGYKSIEKAD